MDYYLNEYSLRGQFKDVEDFLDSLRNNTLTILNKIREQQENIIWKKDTFWQSEICTKITLDNMPQKKNERSSELTFLKIQLIRLANEEPFWGSDDESDIEVKEYNFDEKYRDNFEKINCFIKAIESEGRIVSFIHPAYKIPELSIIILANGNVMECSIENIYTVSWWEKEPEVKSWNISSKYKIEVRAKEFDFHPPHFHASYNEFAAVFKLSNGELYSHGKKKWTSKMTKLVQDWYYIHKEELQEAWKSLHNS